MTDTHDHTKPKLSVRQDAALLATQFLLSSGKLVHRHDLDMKPEDNNKRFFNMNHWIEEMTTYDAPNLDPDEELRDDDGTPRSCGTFQCIGGTCEWLLGGTQYVGETKITEIADHDEGLYDLFYPGQGRNSHVSEAQHAAVAHRNWDLITPEQAALAIANYRAFGDPDWYHVLGLDGGE